MHAVPVTRLTDRRPTPPDTVSRCRQCGAPSSHVAFPGDGPYGLCGTDATGVEHFGVAVVPLAVTGPAAALSAVL